MKEIIVKKQITTYHYIDEGYGLVVDNYDTKLYIRKDNKLKKANVIDFVNKDFTFFKVIKTFNEESVLLKKEKIYYETI